MLLHERRGLGQAAAHGVDAGLVDLGPEDFGLLGVAEALHQLVAERQSRIPAFDAHVVADGHAHGLALAVAIGEGPGGVGEQAVVHEFFEQKRLPLDDFVGVELLVIGAKGVGFDLDQQGPADHHGHAGQDRQATHRDEPHPRLGLAGDEGENGQGQAGEHHHHAHDVGDGLQLAQSYGGSVHEAPSQARKAKHATQATAI